MRKTISYAKWGYIFLIPFVLIYTIFSLVPLLETFGFSFLDYTVSQGSVSSIRGGGEDTIINNGFCGLANYIKVMKSDGIFNMSFRSTVVLWLVGFIPQIVISLLLASWFTDIRLKLKAQGFFKTVMYMPNVIMASALSVLFFSLFTKSGAIDDLLGGPDLLKNEWGARGVVGFINFLMWYGNTTIMLMAAMMGIDTSLYEAAQIDGANPSQVFWQITMPLIKPILAYVFVTSMIGGLQMYDVPYLIGGTQGNPNGVLKTLVSQIQLGKNSSVGAVSALSIIVFIVSAVLGFITLKIMDDQSIKTRYGKKKKK
ncbi:MAG: sugar ABC transporter permease [Ruminococcus sp.]|nr:sugar ABC transporter permease [Ruminococcus sp.]